MEPFYKFCEKCGKITAHTDKGCAVCNRAINPLQETIEMAKENRGRIERLEMEWGEFKRNQEANNARAN